MAAIVLVVAASHARAQTLECATISVGGGEVDANGSFVSVGQPIAGTMSSAEYTLELGVIPCLATTTVPEGCTDAAECFDGDECTMDTCDAGACTSTPVVHLYGDIQPAPNPAATFPCDAEERSRMGDGFLTMLDVMCAFNAMNAGFPHVDCPCADVQPCGGDNFLTMLDVMYIFNTMNDPPGACADPC